MRHGMLGLLIVALVVGAFFLGRWSHDRQPRTDVATAADAGLSGPDADRNAATPAPGGAASAHDVERPGDKSTRPPAVSAAGARSPHVPVSPEAPGPKPLTPEDEQNLDRVMRDWAAHDGGATKDLLDLAQDEDPDAEARRLEALIADSIRRNGGRYTALRLSPPYCTRSVCILRAIGRANAQDPQSDWQRLSGAVMSEPWFRTAFDDLRTMVTGDKVQGTLYVTVFVRCEPGTCRYGR